MRNKIILKLIIGLVIWLTIGTIKVQAAVTCQLSSYPYTIITCNLADTYQLCLINNSNDCCRNKCIQDINCANDCIGAEDMCYKGNNNIGNCGIGFCGSDKSDCCTSSYSNWTKSKITCVNRNSDILNGLNCVPQWITSLDCSLGDKLKNIGDTFLYASDCHCSILGVYKYCCDAAGYPEAAINGGFLTAVDIYRNGQCPGGYIVDGNRVRSVPCTPNCVPTNGTNGVCGAAAGTMHWSMGVGTAPATTNLITQNPLCADGSQPSVSTNADFTYTWTCAGTAGSCGGATGTSASCTAYWLNCNDLNYWAMYPDVKNAGWRPYAHYQSSGQNEGRTWPTSGSTPFCWGGNQITCGNSVVGTPGTNGVCGISNGGNFVTAPSSGLCSIGTASGVTTGTSTYSWTCTGTVGTCPVGGGGTASCAAIRDTVPTFSTINLYNSNNVLVTADTGSRNQICDVRFPTKTIRWVVTANDAQGVSDIGTMQLRFRSSAGSIFTTPLVASSNGSSSFTIDTTTISPGTYNVEVLINDVNNPPGNSGWIDTLRDFKVWNCNVPVTGTMYDGSGGLSCPSIGFSNSASDANFTSLSFNEYGSGNSINTSVNSSMATYTGQSSFVYGTNRSYAADFNDDISVDTNTIDMRLNGTNCSQDMGSFSIESVIDPYADNPSLLIDFSATINQEAWFQAKGGGVIANGNVTDYVPVTCSGVTCSPNVSIANTLGGKGLVFAGGVINTTNKSLLTGNTDQLFNSKKLSKTEYNYDYFYKQYFINRNIGTTFSGDKNWSDIKNNIGTNGITFVSGNLTIDEPITTVNFLMLIAKGDINISPTANPINGILVGENVSLNGLVPGNTSLIINGMVFAANDVNFLGHTNKINNNRNPAVVVNYNPGLLFKLPKEVNKRVTRWKTN